MKPVTGSPPAPLLWWKIQLKQIINTLLGAVPNNSCRIDPPKDGSRSVQHTAITFFGASEAEGKARPWQQPLDWLGEKVIKPLELINTLLNVSQKNLKLNPMGIAWLIALSLSGGITLIPLDV